MTWKEVVYIAILVGVGLVVYLTGLYLDVLIELYGAIFGFLYLIFMPIYFHFSCVFQTRSSGFIKGDDERNIDIELNEC